MFWILYENHVDNTPIFSLFSGRFFSPKFNTVQFPMLCQWEVAQDAGMEHSQDRRPKVAKEIFHIIIISSSNSSCWTIFYLTLIFNLFFISTLEFYIFPLSSPPSRCGQWGALCCFQLGLNHSSQSWPKDRWEKGFTLNKQILPSSSQEETWKREK